jgi:hypothetical protein
MDDDLVARGRLNDLADDESNEPVALGDEVVARGATWVVEPARALLATGPF